LVGRERSHHLGPSISDLLIAATPELVRLTVLHPDEHVELIAEVVS
jgi:hypothetical protein